MEHNPCDGIHSSEYRPIGHDRLRALNRCARRPQIETANPLTAELQHDLPHQPSSSAPSRSAPARMVRPATSRSCPSNQRAWCTAGRADRACRAAGSGGCRAWVCRRGRGPASGRAGVRRADEI